VSHLVAKAEAVINASPADVWDALTNPSTIKQYFFGSDVESDWNVGSPIYWRGEYQGVRYEDKGIITENEKEKVLAMTHWSPMSGVDDKPENYHTVKYILGQVAGGTKVMIEQGNNKDEKQKEHNEGNWKMVLEEMKKLLEKK
jgi:uncharacterized protein YndB with AHSA1/START domain